MKRAINKKRLEDPIENSNAATPAERGPAQKPAEFAEAESERKNVERVQRTRPAR